MYLVHKQREAIITDIDWKSEQSEMWNSGGVLGGRKVKTHFSSAIMRFNEAVFKLPFSPV